MNCRLFPSSSTPSSGYFLSLIHDRDVPDKENIALGLQNSAKMDDDKRTMTGANQAYPTKMTPLAEQFPPSMPSSTNDNSGPKDLSMRGGDMTSAHDSPPKLPLYDTDSEMMRPIALRPSSINSSNNDQDRAFPSLEIALDDEPNILQNQSSAVNSRVRGLRLRPQLRSRPMFSKKELKMPSPLARRGAAERAYLQRQLKAEARMRRKHEQHNEQRKLREDINMAPIDGFGDVDDDRIRTMVERFKSGFGDMGFPQKKSSPPDLSDFGSSPPAILKATFKRSVSAVLEDSGIDEDRNLLFFPDGLPLLNEEEENNLREVAEGTVSRSESPDSLHERCSLGRGDDRSVDFSESGSISISQHSSPLGEVSPSLLPADVIWQLGAFSPLNVSGDLSIPNKANKKVTLRPKMNAHKNNNASNPHPARPFELIDCCKSSGRVSSDAQLKSVSQANTCTNSIDLILDEDKKSFDFESPAKFLAASLSFRQLSKESEDMAENIECAKSDTHVGNKTAPFLFSSPEAGFNHQMFKGKAPPASISDFSLKEPLSEFNYCTPDNSENRRSSRRRLGSRMPKLPELGMPMFDSNVQQMSQGQVSMTLLDATVGGEDVFSPDLLTEPLSDPNYCTPDNSEHRRSSRRQLGARMPRLPELGMPMVDYVQQTFPGKASMALLDATVGGEDAFSPELAGIGLSLKEASLASTNDFLLKEPLSESNYHTPDNSQHRRSTLRQLGARMPKLPEQLGIPMVDSVQQTFPGKASIALLDATVGGPEIVAGDLSLKEPLSEYNFCTPDNHRSFRKQLGD